MKAGKLFKAFMAVVWAWLILSVVIGAYGLVSEIEDRGLKKVVEDIWYGY